MTSSVAPGRPADPRPLAEDRLSGPAYSPVTTGPVPLTGSTGAGRGVGVLVVGVPQPPGGVLSRPGTRW